MTTVRANGIDLYYEIHGSGEPAVLIQGLGANITGWDLQLEPLSRQYQLIAFDNRGAGRSEKPDEAYSIHQMADDTAAPTEELGIQTAPRLGISTCGTISQVLCPRHSARGGGRRLGPGPKKPSSRRTGSVTPKSSWRRRGWSIGAGPTR